MNGVLTLKAPVATAILAGTAVLCAGAGYVISRAILTAQVAVTCPQSPPVAEPAIPNVKGFPPLGTLPSTTEGQKF